MARPLVPDSSEPHQDSRVPEFIQRGKVLIVRRQFQEAVKVCRLGLLAHPTYVEGRLVLSMALMALARHDEVLAEMRVALELSPDNAMAHLLKGEALFHKRDYEQAQEVLEHAHALDPHNEKVRRLLDEIEDVALYGDEPAPRAKTETKVYPAQRLNQSPFAADPSDVLSLAESMPDWSGAGDDDEEPTAAEGAHPNPLLMRPPPAAETVGSMMDTEKDRFGPSVEDEQGDDDEEFTTAPFLPPTHLGQRLKALEGGEWQEPTVTDDRNVESSVIVDPGDLTVEQSGEVEPLAAGESAAMLPLTAEDTANGAGELGWQVDDDPMSSFHTPPPDGPVYEEDPTAVPGRGRSTAPPPLAALDSAPEEDLDEPTVIPGKHRSVPLRPTGTDTVPPIIDEEEDDDTVVNADAPPPEALFGDEGTGSSWERPGTRSPHDPTKAVDLENESVHFSTQRDNVHPGEDDGPYLAVDAVEDPEGTRELEPDRGYDESLAAHEVSSADIFSEEEDSLADTGGTPDPFAAAVLAGPPSEELEPEDLSEISVEMLPDEAEMPPLPADAQNSVVYQLDVDEVEVEVEDPLPPEHLEDDLPDQPTDHATRVKFEVPPDEGVDPHAGADMAPHGGYEAPVILEPDGEARRYVDPPGHYEVPYDEPYDEPPVDPYPPAGPYNRPQEDDDELSLEPADESGEQPWGAGPVPTAALDPDDGRAYAYVDNEPPVRPPLVREPTRETRPGGPQGIRGAVREGAHASQPGGDGMLEQMTGDSGLFLRRAHTDGRAGRARRPLERHPDRTATSWLTILVGEPGSHRWIYLLLSAFGVLALAVAVGLAVRYYRLGEQIEAKRTQAQQRLRAGNMPDFMAAAQSYADIIGRRSDDAQALGAHARILAAIPFEFGDPIPQTSLPGRESAGHSADRSAAQIYSKLYGGSLEQAGTMVLGALREHPDAAILQYLAGRIALLEGRAAAAVRYQEKAHQMAPEDLMVLRSLGNALAAQGKSEAALLAFRKALKINPDHVASLLGKAHLLISTRQRHEDPQVELNTIVVGKRKNLASRGQRGWAYLLLARLYFNKGQLDQAKHHIKRAKSNMPTRDAVFLDELAGVLIDSFQLGEAENAIKESKKVMKGRPQPFHQMARIHLLHGRPRAALEELKRAKGLHYVALNLLRSKILLELGDLQQAEAEVDKALGMAEDLLDAHVVKCKVLAARGRGAEAEAKLKVLLDKHPRNPMLLTAYGEILLKLERLPEARAKFQEAIAHDKHAYAARLKLAEVFMSEGKLDQARNSLAEAVRANPGNIVVLMKQAELEFNMGDLAEAATNYYEAHRRAPNDPNIRLELARVLTLQRKLKQAAKEIDAADAHGAPGEGLALARGRLALYSNKAAAAVTSLLAATRGRPGDREAWGLLVRAHLMNNNTESAQQVAADMARRFRGTPEAVAAAARVDLNEGKSGHAVRRLRPLVQELSSSFRPPRERAGLLVLLGRAYQDNGKLAEAAAQYNDAIKACPLCPEPHYRKGLVQDERGQVSEAVASLKRAVSLDPLYSEVYYDLGQVYERNGQSAAAMESYKKYLTFNPPRDLARAAEDAIRNLESGGGY